MERCIRLIDEDPVLARQVASQLEELGFAVQVAELGQPVRKAAENIDLLILGGLSGLESCRQMRMDGNPVPIILMGAGATAIDRVLALEIGADDYLAKPPSMPELCARVKALFRRLDMASAEQARDLIQIDGMSIDLERHEVRLQGKPVALTAKEFELLSFLASHPGRVFTRGQLLSQVWGYEHDGYEHTVNSHINRLRNKIEPDPANPKHILTVWSVGYKFRDKATASA